MSVIPVLQKIVNGAWHVYQWLIAPLPEREQRLRLLSEAVQLLDEEGGWDIDVDAQQGWDGCNTASDIQVSILFRVEARPDQYAEQHIAYAVDISSWKNMEKDLVILGDHFARAYERSFPYENTLPQELLKEYSGIVIHAQKMAEREATVLRENSLK